MKIKKIIYTIFIIVLLSLTMFISYKVNICNLPKKFINILEYKYNKKNKDFIKIDFISIIINNYKNKSHFLIKDKKELEIPVLYNDTNPIVYIYNTHSNEEYSYSKNNIYNITPTVLTAAYILESELKKLGIESVVETKNTIDIVNERGLSYASSYKVSRELLENKIQEYPSLMYFIDLHRDSVKRSITTTEIDGVSYAKTMFLLGLENENYMKNKEVMTSLNNYLDSNYKGLSRGIYEKQGYGVNGIYNQDFNSNTMLIEVGGVDNTIDEVANSLKIIANCLYNYIESNKTTRLE